MKMADGGAPRKGKLGALAQAAGAVGRAARQAADMRAIKEAGRAAHQEQSATRAALDAEIAEQMARLPARNKRASIEAGLYHGVGGGKKLSRPTRGMHATTVADPEFNPPEIGIITPEQLVREEAALFPLVGDRAAAGRYLTHVGENELEVPVRLTGGARFMDANFNRASPEESAAWESGAGVVSKLGNVARRAGEGGRPAYGIYTAGSGTNTDFNVMGTRAILQQLPFSKVSNEAESAFDRAMREKETTGYPAIPDWPGLGSPMAEEMLLNKNNGILRTKFMQLMGEEAFQSMGFPDVAATRKAITEPELLDVPTHQSGFRLARMDPEGRVISNPIIPSDYPIAMAGKVAGRLDVPADYKDVFQSHFNERRLLGQPESGDYYSFVRAKPIQYANDEWLNRLMEQRLANERRIKEGSYNKGGAAGKAAVAIKSAAEKARRGERASRVESYRDQPTQAIEDWKWRPLQDVAGELNITQVPEYIQRGYGSFMADQAARAARGDLNARDLIKAYTITRSSVNRGGRTPEIASSAGMRVAPQEGLVRPEGAFAQWLMTPLGQRYLNAAQKGRVDSEAIADLQAKFNPFGMPNVLAQDMAYAATVLPRSSEQVSERVLGPLQQYQQFATAMKGIGPAKKGFLASMLGRGDIPTLDARQIRAHTGEPGSSASRYMARRGGRGGDEAVERLARRQEAMGVDIDPELEPFYQHLTHHAVWDKVGGERTTHDDLVKALAAAGVAGMAALPNEGEEYKSGGEAMKRIKVFKDDEEAERWHSGAVLMAQGGAINLGPVDDNVVPDSSDAGQVKYGYADGGAATANPLMMRRAAREREGKDQFLGEFASRLSGMAGDQAREEVASLNPRAVTDLINRGLIADSLGAPVDLINMGLQVVGRGSERPVGGSQQLRDLMDQYGITSGVDRPMMELATGIFGPGAAGRAARAAPAAVRAAESGLNRATAAAARPFVPATVTMEAVAPDLGQLARPAWKETVTRRLMGPGAPVEMGEVAGRRTVSRPAQGAYLNEAGELETNPMRAIDVPRAGNLSSNRALRADVSTAGRELGQESVAAHRFLPIATNNPADASAMLISTKGGLTGEDVKRLAQELPHMIVAHNPRLGGVVVMPYEPRPGAIPTEFVDAQRVARQTLGDRAKYTYGRADVNKDRMYIPRSEYVSEGAREPSAASTTMRERLKRAEQRIGRGSRVPETQ